MRVSSHDGAREDRDLPWGRDFDLTVPDEVGSEEPPQHGPLDRDRGQPGSAMVAPKRAKPSPLALKAKRLVRLETGRSSEAEFAR